MSPSRPTPAAPRADRAAIIALLIVQVIFATLHVVGKVVLAEIPALAFAASRVLIAAPLLAVMAWRHDRVIPTGRDWRALAVLGLLGIFANQVLYLVGLRFTTATNAAILMPSIPVFTVAAAALLGAERLTARRVAGVALAAVGALVLLDPARIELGEKTSLGNLLVAGNCLCYAFYLVLLRPLFARLPWRTVVAGSFVTGGAATLLVSLPTLARVDWPEVHGATWLALAYVGVFPTFGTYALNTWAVRRSSPSVAAAFTTLQPMFTAVLAAFFLHERFGWLQAAGFGLIVAGLVIVSRKN
ncbi:MAG: DMT family transporter [Thermoanaerobaculia bacterium]